MSFLDELKNAQKQQQKEECRFNRDWDILKESFINYIKKACRQMAISGSTQRTVYLQDYIEYIENEHTSQYVDGYESDTITEIEFHNTEEGMMWSRLRNKFYHYICEERQRYSMPYPNVIGMSKQDASNLAENLVQRLIKEQLAVKMRLIKQYVKVHYEGKEEVVDEQMYSFCLEISW